MRLILYLGLIALIKINTCYSQSKVNDSIHHLSDEDLLNIIDNYRNENSLKIKAAYHYLKRGKISNDTILIARGYDRLARLFDPITNLKYVDSIINLTSTIENITYPGQAYLLKASNLKKLGDIHGAIDNLIISHYRALDNGNASHEAYSMHMIVFYKTYWGNPEEALKLQNKFLTRIKSDNFLTELQRSFRDNDINEALNYRKDLISEAILNQSTCLIEMGEYQNAKKLVDSALNLKHVQEYPMVHLYFIESLMEIYYYMGQYKKSISMIDELIVLEKKLLKNEYKKRPNISFFEGMANYKLQRTKNAIELLKYTDSAYYSKRNLYYRKHREMYPILVEYYKNNSNSRLHLNYLNRQIEMDSVLMNSFLNVDKKIFNEFETPKLLAEKEELIAQLEWEKGREKRKQLFIGLLLALSMISTIYYFWRQKQYKLRFQQLVDKGLQATEAIESPIKRNGISAAIVDDILKNLEKFEREEQFTNPDISLQKVAKRFNTNSSYLSKVINLKKDKNFSQYITELRIAYAVNELQNNPRFRKYTVKAIAEEVGFGNAQSFSKAFYARTGLRPSYFVKNLNKKAS